MKYYIYCKDELLLRQTADGFEIPQGDEPPVELKPWTHLMNVDGDKACCVDTPVTNLEGYEMCGLRKSYYLLSQHDYLKAGKCHELLYWDQNTRYCGVCGAPMRMDTDISKKCTQCGKEVWPQLAIAVIVLIHKGDEVLLVNARNFRTHFYGLVAGFVETGETLEQAVEREVMEEVGLRIKNIRYFDSQPWPYPSGLMVGFNADYDSGELHVQRDELRKAAWFHRDHLPQLPEKLSIARKLIDNWLIEN